MGSQNNIMPLSQKATSLARLPVKQGQQQNMLPAITMPPKRFDNQA